MVTCLVQDSDGYCLVQDTDNDLFGTGFCWLLVWYRILTVTCLVQDSDGYLFGTGF